MANNLHSHSFGGTTSIVNGHEHQYLGETSKVPDSMEHTHYIEGDTTNKNGHTHHYRLQSSPAIHFNGTHYHYYKGDTAITNTHLHNMEGYTTIYQE